MSRHGRIVQDLYALKEQGVIEAFQREAYENEPTRARWFVMMDKVTNLYLSTTEAESLIIGAKKALTIR